MNAQQAWQATVGQLQMEMPKASFDTWVRNAELVKQDNGRYVIGVQNNYARDWLESRLASTVSRLLSGFSNGPAQVEFVVWHKDVEQEFPGLRDEPGPIEVIDVQTNRTLITRYHFDNFVVVQATAWRTPPAWPWRKTRPKPTTPCFFTAGWGWEKLTSHAIATPPCGAGCKCSTFPPKSSPRADQCHPHAAYPGISRTLSQHRCAADRRYRFIAGKESTQEEFFHTSTPCTTRKNRSIASDRRPKPWSPWRSGCVRASNGVVRLTSSRPIWKRALPTSVTKANAPCAVAAGHSRIDRTHDPSTSANWKGR